MITLAVLFVVCLVLSAFFSGSEMAFVSTSPFKLREMAEAGNRRAMKMVALRERPQSFLTAVLIGNNIVNAGATSIAAYIFQVYLGITNEWFVTAVMAPILIIFGEMLPKDYGRLQQHHILLKSAGVLSFMTWLFRVPSFLINKTIGALFGNLGNLRGKSIFVSEKEFRMLIEEGAQAGVLEHHEKQLIDRILDFEKLHVQSVMTPIDQVASVSITGTVRDVKDVARKTQSRIVLVYEEIPSIVVGMIYVFDLLFEENEDQSLKNYLRSPIFLSHQTSAETAFLTLQQKRQSVAFVMDPEGEVAGVVPIERLMAV